MTIRSTFFRALTVPERGAAGGFVLPVLLQYGEKY